MSRMLALVAKSSRQPVMRSACHPAWGVRASGLSPAGRSRRPSRWRVVLAYTAIEVAVPWLLLSNAERRLSSSLTGLLIAAVPLIGAALALLVRADDRLDLRRAFGLLVGFVGVAALLGLNLS